MIAISIPLLELSLSDDIAPQRKVRDKAVTVKDVAARAGVHHASVSVVLNGAKSGTGLSAQTRQRIIEAAEELGYKRNSSMVAGRTGRFGCVALLLSTNAQHSNLPQRLWQGVHDELAEQQMTLSIARLPDDEITRVVPKMLREWMVDGLLVDYTDHIPSRMMEMICSNNLPAVWINSKQPSDCVRPDDFEAGRRATEHLLDMGHRRIAYLDLTHAPDESEEHYSVRDRFEGYQAVMTAHGLKTQNLSCGVLPGAPVKVVKEALSAPAPPTAFLCYGIPEPAAVFIAAASLGKRIPEDVSVMTFETLGASIVSLSLTSMVLPEYEVGRNAVQMLMRKVYDPLCCLNPQAVPFALQTGQTCAPPNLLLTRRAAPKENDSN